MDHCQDLMLRFRRLRLDVAALQDTRLSSSDLPFALARLRRAMEPEYRVYGVPTAAAPTETARSAKVGGQILCIRQRKISGWALTRLHKDPSDTGAFVALELHHISGRRARVISVYIHNPA